MTDVVIIGGGAAGLSAALLLGRARRNVLVLDGGQPRNAPAAAAHGVFTREGTPPLELLQIARDQLRGYPSIEVRDDAAVSIDAGTCTMIAAPLEVLGRMTMEVFVREQRNDGGSVAAAGADESEA